LPTGGIVAVHAFLDDEPSPHPGRGIDVPAHRPTRLRERIGWLSLASRPLSAATPQPRVEL